MVLTFLFSPLGIFYVSILWAVVFIVLAIIVAVLTFGLGLLLVLASLHDPGRGYGDQQAQ